MRLSKVCLGLAAVVLAGAVTTVQATPTCLSTMVLPGGNGTVLDSSLTPGVCVQSGDKVYGNFNLGTLAQPGSVTFASGPQGHSITFTGPFAPGNTYTDSYEVEVLGTSIITQLRADITQTSGGPTTFVETTSTLPVTGGINFFKIGNTVFGSFSADFSPAQSVTDLILTATLTTGPGSDSSAALNTFVETQPKVGAPEPAALELLGIGLTGLTLAFRRKRA